MSELPPGTGITFPPETAVLRRGTGPFAQELINEDLGYCLGRLERIEDQVSGKISEYENRILGLLEEKRKTEILEQELRDIKTRLSRTRTLAYAAFAAAALALIRPLF